METLITSFCVIMVDIKLAGMLLRSQSGFLNIFFPTGVAWAFSAGAPSAGEPCSASQTPILPLSEPPLGWRPPFVAKLRWWRGEK